MKNVYYDSKLKSHSDKGVVCGKEGFGGFGEKTGRDIQTIASKKKNYRTSSTFFFARV